MKISKTFHIQWHITDLCNLRCRHCYQDRFDAENNLPFEKLEKVFSNIYDFIKRRQQRLVLDITGGEPLLHKRWQDIVSLAYNSEITKELGIITNGFFFTKKNISFLKKFNSLKIKISAEGITKEGYELYRGVGTHERFLQSCELLKKELPVTERTLMFTLAQDNISQVPLLFDFIKKYRFDKLILERFIPWGTGAKLKENVITQKQWEDILKFLHKKCDLEYEQEALFPYKGFMVQVDTKEGFNLFGAPCIIGVDGIAVMPDGSVLPCRRFPITIGNVAESPLSHIWENSDILKQATNKFFLKGKCKKCTIKSCKGCRALAYSVTGDFLEEDPLCLIKTKMETFTKT